MALIRYLRSAMIDMNALIERIAIPQPEITQGERDFAKITNNPEPERKPKYYYRNKETGDEYAHVAGGFYPEGRRYPGFAIIVALAREIDVDHQEHLIMCLEEFEPDRRVGYKAFVSGCIDLQQKYYTYPILQGGFHCEMDEAAIDRYYAATHGMQNEENGFYPLPGPYADQPNAFKSYLELLQHKKSVLVRGDCEKLKNYMMTVKREEDLARLKPFDVPAITAIAFAVGGVLQQNPVIYDTETVFNLEEY